MKKIFIAGGSGLLGYNSIKYLKSKKYNVFSSYNKNLIINEEGIKPFKINLTNYEDTFRLINNIKPDVLINFAGLTNVESCEKYPKSANELNVGITHNLSKISNTLDIAFVQMSTDHLFNKKNFLFSENDKTNPLNTYSKTKLKSEECATKNNINSLIIRSNFFCSSSSNKKSFIDLIKFSLQKNKPIHLFKDVTFTPISFYLMLDYILLLIKNNKTGTFNIAGNENLTKYDFGILLAKFFDFDINLIKPILITEKKLVHRPHNMSLDNSKLKKVLNIEIPKIQDQLKIFYERFNYSNS